MNGIEVKNISKRYGDVLALDSISLRFEENTIYGLLGRNGAGKTTLLNSITGRIFTDTGDITVDGVRVVENDAALRKIILTSEKTLYPENMKVKDAFKWTKEFYPDFDLEYAVKIAGQFELNTGKRVKALSTGFTSIFKLIIALSANTPYVLFDEPVLGLDANNRDLFYRLLIEKHSQHPFTAVISSHLIDEITSVIERAVIIKNGRVIKDEPLDSLLSEGYTVSGTTQKVDAYIGGKNVLDTENLGGLKTAYILGNIDSPVPDGLEISRLDLQKLFIQLTNS